MHTEAEQPCEKGVSGSSQERQKNVGHSYPIPFREPLDRNGPVVFVERVQVLTQSGAEREAVRSRRTS